MKAIVCIAVAGMIACTAFLSKGSTQTAALLDNDATSQETTHHNEEQTDANGCEAGCSTSNHPVEPLTRVEYLHLLDNYAKGEDRVRTAALETLLFHGFQIAGWVENDKNLLASDDAARLTNELAKTHVRVWMRIVDDNGTVRARIDGERFPIGEKQHVHMTDALDLPAPEISGTVHRTGLHHLWTRM